MTGSKQRYFDGLTASQRYKVRQRQAKTDALIAASPGIEWRLVEGHPDYFVGSDGQIRRGPKLLRGAIHPTGYCIVQLNGTFYKLHRLIAQTFLGPIPPGAHVRHLNDVKTDNRVTNLAIGTRSDNMRDRVRNGNDPNRRKTHCRNGHPFDAENTVWRERNDRLSRACRICLKAADARYWAAKRNQRNAGAEALADLLLTRPITVIRNEANA